MTLWFSEFMVNVHPIVRFAIAVVVTVVLTFIAWRIVRKRRDALIETPDGAPDTVDALNVTLTILLTAFVFLAALLLAQGWTLAGNADSAARDEQVAMAEVFSQAQLDGAKAAPIIDAVKGYAKSVSEVEARALKLGDPDVALASHMKASQGLLGSYRTVYADDLSSGSSIASSMRDAIRAGGDRIGAVPTENASRILVVLAALGILSLAVGVITAPGVFGARVIFLGIMAVTIAFLYCLVVEMMNPFVSAVSLMPPGLSAVG